MPFRIPNHPFGRALGFRTTRSEVQKSEEGQGPGPRAKPSWSAGPLVQALVPASLGPLASWSLGPCVPGFFQNVRAPPIPLQGLTKFAIGFFQSGHMDISNLGSGMVSSHQKRRRRIFFGRASLQVGRRQVRCRTSRI